MSKKAIHKSTVQYIISDVLNFITVKYFCTRQAKPYYTKITIRRSRVTANLPVLQRTRFHQSNAIYNKTISTLSGVRLVFEFHHSYMFIA